MAVLNKNNNIDNINILSYNLHGFNQGVPLLEDVMKNNNYEIIFVQETWLSSRDFNKLGLINSDYNFIATSAVDKKLETDILLGRPFGGMAVFFKQGYAPVIKCLHKSSRLIIIQFNDIILANVYLPSQGNTNASQNDRFSVTEEVLSSVAHVVQNVRINIDQKFLLAGDFNSHINEEWLFDNPCVNKFISDNNLVLINKILTPNLNYTYAHPGLNQYTMLDYCIVSENLKHDINKYCIIDSAINLSDHLPILISLTVEVSDLASERNKINRKSDEVKCMRWDLADLKYYYEQTRVAVTPLFEKIKTIFDNSANSTRKSDYLANQCSAIETIYVEFVKKLADAANCTIPMVKKNSRKYWWDQELKDLKDISCETHNIWKASGRPHSGTVFDSMIKAKLTYKRSIKSKQASSKLTVTNDLHEALLNKDTNNFWKIWNSKFNSKSKESIMIDGLTDQLEIANSFANFFEKTCSANDSAKNAEIKKTATFMFSQYNNNSNAENFFVTTSEIDEIVSKLKFGKAPGFDGVMAEHIRYAHPVVIVFLVNLFNLMMKNCFVPQSFGVGLTIPIPKESTFKFNSSTKDYRCITISPVVSKKFENCILLKFGDLLESSPYQFGFKKNSGCRDVIYTLKTVSNFYIENGSTMNVCTMDINKAFDKVNHHSLLIKLMNHNLPKFVISIILYWYENSFSIIKWNNCLSEKVKLTHGVRQGGVLSPILFAIVVDDILCTLNNSNMGCKVFGMPFVAIMYADDIILMTASVQHMQILIDVCVKELKSIDLTVNPSKTMWLRIGIRNKVTCSPLNVDSLSVNCVEETKILGTIIVSSTKFKISLSKNKTSFFISVNNLFSKLGCSDVAVFISLMNSHCLSTLLYNLEVLDLSKSEVNSLNFVLTRTFMKLFKTFSNENILNCMFYSGQLPIDLILLTRKASFLKKLIKKDNLLTQTLALFIENDLLIVCNNWNAQGGDYPCKDEAWNIFECRLRKL